LKYSTAKCQVGTLPLMAQKKPPQVTNLGT